jgi:beta-aspartyl-peptidase (threonine type)
VVLLVAQGAERFAAVAGIPFCDPADLIVERERKIWEELHARGDYRTIEGFANMPDIPPIDHPADTVGAVALDTFGNLAAGTSTGGVSYKPPGRVGDTPLIGAGLYADNETGACSTTGWGETIIKVLLAKTATDFIGAGYAPMQAAQAAIERLARRANGLGGCILLDRQGRVGFAFNTPRMAYAYRVEGEDAVEGMS